MSFLISRLMPCFERDFARVRAGRLVLIPKVGTAGYISMPAG